MFVLPPTVQMKSEGVGGWARVRAQLNRVLENQRRGFAIMGCCCGSYRQARDCITNAFVDVWFIANDYPTGAFVMPAFGYECLHVNMSDATSSSHGTVYLNSDAVVYPDCATCLAFTCSPPCDFLMIRDWQYYFFSAPFSLPSGCSGIYDDSVNICGVPTTGPTGVTLTVVPFPSGFCFWQIDSESNSGTEIGTYGPNYLSDPLYGDASRILFNPTTGLGEMIVYAYATGLTSPGVLLWGGTVQSYTATSITFVQVSGCATQPATITVDCAPEVDCATCPNTVTATLGGTPPSLGCGTIMNISNGGYAISNSMTDLCNWSPSSGNAPVVDARHSRRFSVHFTEVGVPGNVESFWLKSGPPTVCPTDSANYLPGVPYAYGRTMNVT